MSAKPSDTTKLIMNVQSCIEAVKAWMAPNKLKMNDDKTEMMTVATSQKLRSLDADHVCIGSDRVKIVAFQWTVMSIKSRKFHILKSGD